MLAFIESIIKLLVNLLFVERLSKNNEELRAEVQQLRQEKEESAKENQLLKQEKEELAKAKAEVIENHFSLFQKYLALNKQKEELDKQLDRYQSPQWDIDQQFSSEDLKVLDQLFEEFNPSEELTI